MKRRQLLIGSLLGTAGMALGIKSVIPAEAATVSPETVNIGPLPGTIVSLAPGERLIPLGFPAAAEFAPMAWIDDSLDEFRIQAIMERMRQSSWYQLYQEHKVMEHLGIEPPPTAH